MIYAALVVFVLDTLVSFKVITSSSPFLTFDTLTAFGLVLLTLHIIFGSDIRIKK